MRLPNNEFFRHVDDLDVSGLKRAILDNIPARDWNGAYRRKSDMHQLNDDVKSIVIRHGVSQGSPMYRNTEAYDLIADPLEAVLDQLPGADRIRLASLKPGGKIPLHFDAAPYFELQHRLHIPIITNPDVYFTVGNETKVMEVGEVWEINNIVEHKVVNSGGTSRIHMVVDYYDI